MSLVISKVFTYDTDAGNYIQAVEAADQADTPGIGALEPAVRQAINNFVIGCKQDGIWNAIKASCILAGAKTLEGSFIDLKSATKILTNNNFADGTYVGSNYTTGDYNRKTGLLGNGTTKNLDASRSNNVDPQDSFHLSVFASSIVQQSGTRYFLGSSYSATGWSGIGWSTSDSGLFGAARRGSATIRSPYANGFVGVNRADSTQILFRNNALTTVASNVSQTPSNSALRVFSNSTGAEAGSHRLAFYSIGESLDLAKLDARVTDLITAFGAAIP